MLTNWVQLFKPLTDTGEWIWGLDGMLRPRRLVHPIDTAWIYAKPRMEGTDEAGFDCGGLTIMHNLVFAQKAVHSFCMECYKVAACPKSLVQAHKIAEWQAETDWAGKVGSETREYTQRVWGAYWYCRGVEQGRERYKVVRKWVDENLGEDVKVFLKRGCTEFEQHMGASDKWEKIPDQDELEAEALKVLDLPPVHATQCEAVRHHVLHCWELWDKGNQLPVTYHEEK